MERYETLFAQLKNRQEGAFVPFVTLCDPGPEQSLKIIDALIEAGADALELGIPFSDPLADGPTIQGATLRAFAAGVTPAQCRSKSPPRSVRQRCAITLRRFSSARQMPMTIYCARLPPMAAAIPTCYRALA